MRSESGMLSPGFPQLNQMRIVMLKNELYPFAYEHPK
jgi:hypothetical protein